RPVPAVPRAGAGAAHRAAGVRPARPVRLPGAVPRARGVAPAPLRARRRGGPVRRPGDRLQLPRQTAEHLHRQADPGDVRRRAAAGARDRGAAGAVASVGRRWAGTTGIPSPARLDLVHSDGSADVAVGDTTRAAGLSAPEETEWLTTSASTSEPRTRPRLPSATVWSSH